MRLNTPDEASILIGIALTEQSFHERAHTSDWLSRFSEPRAADNYWHDVYLPLVVEPIEDLVKKAKSLGARIAEGTLSALAQATAQSNVVIIMAHWRDFHIESEDLTCTGVDDWRRRALLHPSPLSQWVAARLGQGVSSIAEILNGSLEVEFPPDDGKPREPRVVESLTIRAARRRDELDSIFEEMIKPGNRLELLDGLHSKEEIENAIAKDFNGVLDFAACTSTFLGDYVTRTRQHRLRVVQAPNTIEFVASAPIVGTTLDLLASGLFSYQEAATQARRLWELTICAQ
jgi:hypothetical protein